MATRQSTWLIRALRGHLNRYIARHFHALRVSRTGPIPELPGEPVVVVVNHPSWWDPLIGLALSGKMSKERRHFAPIESGGLAQYPILERLGFFGIEVGTPRGSRDFLTKSLRILTDPNAVLWITAQGKFVDCRERPLVLKEGIGHLAKRMDRGLIVPLALEYPFWNDRCPEALAMFGHPIRIDARPFHSPHEWTALIAGELQNAQDRLAEEALRRDPEQFEVVLGGTAGVGGVYDAWRRFRASRNGRGFRAEHQIAHPAGPIGSESPAASLPAESRVSSTPP